PGPPERMSGAGEPHYRRYSVHINDFYILDMSGYGGGIEDVNLGVGKLAVAYLGGARPDIVTNNGNYAKSNIDVRLYDIPAPLGRMGVWFDLAISPGGTQQDGTAIPSATGWAVGIGHQRLE